MADSPFFMVAEDAYGDLAIWRYKHEGDELPQPLLYQFQVKDSGLWNLIVETATA